MTAGTTYSPLLHIRAKDDNFFKKNIQVRLEDEKKFDSLKTFAEDMSELENESRTNIRANCRTLMQRIEDTFLQGSAVDQEKLFAFFKFVMSHCYLIVVIKATTEGFNNIFLHIRMLYVKKKAQRSVIDEFKDFVMPRIDSAENFIDKDYDSHILSVEHVLPQTVNENSQWDDWWQDKTERAKWIHRIANLVPLNRRKNSVAQNYDFNRKKNVYFIRRGTLTYPLTTQVIMESEWRPETVKNRQDKLMGVFKNNWELD